MSQVAKNKALLASIRKYNAAKRAALSKPQKSQVRKIAKRQVTNILESKYIDASYTMSPTYNGLINPLVNIARGDTDAERDGDTVRGRSLMLYFDATVNTLSSGTNVFRIIIFSWKPQRDSASPPAVNDVLANTSSGVGSLYAPLCDLNHDGRQDFVVHYDKIFTLCQSSNTSQIVKRRRLKVKRKMQFDGSSVTITTNEPYVLVISDQQTNAPTVHIRTRYNFLD